MAKTPGARRGAPRPGRKPRVAFTKKLANDIAELMSDGLSMSGVSREPNMPSLSTMQKWMKTKPVFAEAVRLAREAAGDMAADAILSTVREVTPATASAARVKLAGLQWTAAKAAPHRYGAKAESAPAEPVRLVIRVRRFEKAVGPDGVTYLREIMPEGEQ